MRNLKRPISGLSGIPEVERAGSTATSTKTRAESRTYLQGLFGKWKHDLVIARTGKQKRRLIKH
jgi:hypothetical protein